MSWQVFYWVCRSLRKNIEEELHELNSRVAEMSSETGEAAIQKLQSEIKFYKNILQCSVCTDRPKEVRKNILSFFSSDQWLVFEIFVTLVKSYDELIDSGSLIHCQVVIVKCFHLFCNYCVQKNLEIRHRKCPACGTPFGQSDIRFVKIWKHYPVIMMARPPLFFHC